MNTPSSILKNTSLLVVIAFLATGCVKSSLAELTEKMGDNNATVAAKVMTPYGSGQLIRTNPKDGQEVTIHPDGSVTVRSYPNKDK